MVIKNWLFVMVILAVGTVGFAQTATKAGNSQGKTASQPSQPATAAAEQKAPSVVTQASSQPATASAILAGGITPVAEGEGFVAPREEVPQEEQTAQAAPRVVFNPKNKRDPTLSPDDVLLIKFREQERLYAIELEEERKREAEKRKKAEEERKRQIELENARDPSKNIRNKIHVSGVIGKEVFIGSKVYTIGDRVLGARIEEVHPEYVIFVYKGQRFRRNVKL